VSSSSSSFIHTILDNLRTAGVQNTKKGERLRFDRLDAYPGEFLQAEGTYTEDPSPNPSPKRGGEEGRSDPSPNPSPKRGGEKAGSSLPLPASGRGPGGGVSSEGVSPSTKRVAVCIGPEFGTVGPELLADAAREAHRGIGFDLLLVCGFAFDPHVAE